MDRTIRNLDPEAYKALRARAVLLGKTVGELINDAIRSYLARPDPFLRRRSLRDLEPEAYAEGTEHLSEEVDAIVYGEAER